MKHKYLWMPILSLILISCSSEKEDLNMNNLKTAQLYIDEDSELLSETENAEVEKENASEADKQTELYQNFVYLQLGRTNYDYIGYISIEENTLYIDPVELIETGDTERIAELNLDEQADMPSGYYFYNSDDELLSFQITEKTQYHFISWDVVDPEGRNNPFTVTTNTNIFLAYLETYGDSAATYPFFIVLDGGCVKYVIEKPFA